MTTSKYSRIATPAALQGMSLGKLLDLWELTSAALETPELATVRGWLMDEIERRSPKGFDRWLDQDAPEDSELRYFIEEG